MTISRRTVLKSFGAAGAGPLLGACAAETQGPEVRVAGRPVELSIAPVGARIVRVSLAQIDAGGPRSIPDVGRWRSGSGNQPSSGSHRCPSPGRLPAAMPV